MVMDWLITVGTNGMSCGSHLFSDLDFADDVFLLAKLLKLLVPALETMALEATSLGLEVNWQKTKVQALGSREDEPLTITVLGQEVAAVEEFVYLGSLIHSTTQSSHEFTSQCHHSCSYAKTRQSEVEDKNLHIVLHMSRINHGII